MQAQESQRRGQPINGWSADYIDAMYAQFRRDPASLDERTRAFFEGFELGDARGHAPAGEMAAGTALTTSDVGHLESLQSAVDSLVYHYRDIGHFLAKTDPLGLNNRTEHENLKLEAFGLGAEHLDMKFWPNHIPGHGERLTLREIIALLEETYCRSIGVEYMDIQETAERRWLQQRMEPTRNRTSFSPARKKRIASMLRRATAFEKFLQTSFVGQKRFSLEGGESLIPLLDTIIERGPASGLDAIIMGMAHRGRLNVLGNIMRKGYDYIFGEFEDNYEPGQIMGDGDVKYHKGYEKQWTTESGEQIALRLAANPSHLEAVNPVVLGRVRARQRNHADTGDRSKVVGLLIHGDAAFAGQGIVQETLNLSQLEGYKTGGTIHVVVNNQIGFTTIPKNSRSGNYCTDIAKFIQAPIFHVNGDDPEAVVHVAEIALEFRQKFHKDVVIDMVCYRRHGHNEGDDASQTQPAMYEVIKKHPAPFEIYNRQLLAEGVVSAAELDHIAAEMDQEFNDAAAEAKKHTVPLYTAPFKSSAWDDMQPHYSHTPIETGVDMERLREIAATWERFPEGFELHKTVRKILSERRRNVDEGRSIDWATGEALAIGSLLTQGIPVRISGQDSRRGTFSHRHAAVFDTRTQEHYKPLNNIKPGQANFCVYDSPLSEAAVLGFDYGYSLGEPDMLICWEAQFGDFANGAQTIIDQFIATSESKWGRYSGLVMMLPHGYEGQGPEHSSGWLERFLQLCAEDNIQVCNLTTPSQYFHLLRRQMLRDFRKPLVLMTPKSLLRLPAAVSPVAELTTGHFRDVIDDASGNPADVRRVVLCSGKVYYDLLAAQAAAPADAARREIAIVRLEQFYPFPKDQLAAVLGRYKGATEFVWCQEETQNKGAWTFVSDFAFDELGLRLRYVGRERAASPAVGSLKRHRMEQEALLAEALAVPSAAKAMAGR